MRAFLFFLFYVINSVDVLASPLAAHNSRYEPPQLHPPDNPGALSDFRFAPFQRSILSSSDYKREGKIKDSIRAKSFSFDSLDKKPELIGVYSNRVTDIQLSSDVKLVYKAIRRAISPLGLYPDTKELSQLEVEWNRYSKKITFYSWALDPTAVEFIPHVGTGKHETWVGVNLQHFNWMPTLYDLASHLGPLAGRGEAVSHIYY